MLLWPSRSSQHTKWLPYLANVAFIYCWSGGFDDEPFFFSDVAFFLANNC